MRRLTYERSIQESGSRVSGFAAALPGGGVRVPGVGDFSRGTPVRTQVRVATPTMATSAEVAPMRWKRSSSESSLLLPKRGRWEDLNSSRSSEDISSSSGSDQGEISVDQSPAMIEVPPVSIYQQQDTRDLLQMTLDHICDLQRSFQSSEQSSNVSDYEADDDDEGEEDVGEDTESDGEWDNQVVMAGYDVCTKEALRFLVEEERLGSQHPAVRTLSAHLEARSQQLDCRRVLQDYLARKDDYSC